MQKTFTKLNISKYLEKVFPKQIYAKAFEAESQTLKEMLGAHSSSVLTSFKVYQQGFQALTQYFKLQNYYASRALIIILFPSATRRVTAPWLFWIASLHLPDSSTPKLPTDKHPYAKLLL